jgi:hypothetical protein
VTGHVAAAALTIGGLAAAAKGQGAGTARQQPDSNG